MGLGRVDRFLGPIARLAWALLLVGTRIQPLSFIETTRTFILASFFVTAGATHGGRAEQCELPSMVGVEKSSLTLFGGKE